MSDHKPGERPAADGDGRDVPWRVHFAFGSEPDSWSGVRLIAEQAGLHAVVSATEGLRHWEMVREVLGAGGRPESERHLPLPGSPRLTSHLSHNWILRSFFLSDVVVTMARLLGRGVSEVVIPELRCVDTESLLALLALYQRTDLPRPILKIGVGGVGPAGTADERGIEWSVPSHMQQRFAVSFRGAALRPHSGVELLNEQGAGARSGAAARSAAVAFGGGSPQERLTRVRWWFFTHGFTSALREALALLAAEVDLVPAERAELLHLAGLAAHNRQFHSTPEQRLEGFLWSCFSDAISLEQDPERQAALCYRLAVVAGRRQKRLDAGEEWARRGISLAAAELPVRQAAYQRAWCGNLLCYFLIRRRETSRALAENTASVDDLGSLIGGLLDQSPEEFRMEDWDLLTTRHILANYGVTMSILCREWAAGLSFIGTMHSFFRVFPGAEYLDALTLLPFYRTTGALRAVLSLSENARHAAAAALDFQRSFELTCIAGDQADRLGDHGRAATLFQEARELREGLGPLVLPPALDVPLAAILLRAGRPAAAEEVLQQALPPVVEAESVAADLRAEVAMLLAFCSGRRGDREQAEERVNAAIEAAVESGRETTLVRCALAAAEVARMFGDLATARQALQQAVDLLSRSLAEGDGVLAAEGVRLITGLWELGQRGAELRPWIERTVRHARQALQDPGIWTLLGSWTAVICAVLGPHLDEDDELQEGLRWIRTACREQELHATSG